jgi:Uma2 family endonuclease
VLKWEKIKDLPMVTSIKRISVIEFDDWVNLPEQADHLYEFIGGEIFEVPSNPYSSEIAGEILFQIKLFLRENKIDGHVTGESGGYEVSGERYAPDVAYIPSAKQAQLPYKQGYNPNPPDLAVEVMSPNDSERKLSIKVANYLAASVVVWVVRPEEKEVEIYVAGQPVQVLTVNDTINGSPVLPGFALPVKAIFPNKDG